MRKICIAYVTETNTTKEIADEIGDIAGKRGVIPDVLPLDAVKDIGQYDAFVIGAPVYGMRWKQEANAFVEKHREALKKVPTAFFLDAYMLNNAYKFWQKRIHACFDKASKFVKPVKTGYFGGRVPDPLPGPMRLIFGVKKDAPLDVRDWNAIRAWSEELMDMLTSGKA